MSGFGLQVSKTSGVSIGLRPRLCGNGFGRFGLRATGLGVRPGARCPEYKEWSFGPFKN